MDAAATHPEQLGLDGMPAAPHRGIDVEGALKLSALAVLIGDPVVRQNSRGQVVVEVLLHQQIEHHPQATPLHAVLVVDGGHGYADDLDQARATAARLTAGAEVIVVGHGLEPGRHHGQPVLRLLHTAGLMNAADVTPTPEPRHAH